MSAPGVLIVCTGNVCRSPYIERRLETLLGPEVAGVTSAGTGALVGSPVDPDAVTVLEGVGGSAAGFEARQIIPAMAAEAQLIITVSRDHRGQVARLTPKALRTTFAIGDLHDLAESLLERTDPGTTYPSTSALVAALAQHRPFVVPRSVDGAGIADPYRQGPEAFRAMSAHVEALLPPIVEVLRRVRAV